MLAVYHGLLIIILFDLNVVGCASGLVELPQNRGYISTRCSSCSAPLACLYTPLNCSHSPKKTSTNINRPTDRPTTRPPVSARQRISQPTNELGSLLCHPAVRHGSGHHLKADCFRAAVSTKKSCPVVRLWIGR